MRCPRLARSSLALLVPIGALAACTGERAELADPKVTTTVETVDPTTTPPPTTEPATTEPATTEPATTEPATTEPATTEPATTEPATTEATTTTTTIAATTTAAPTTIPAPVCTITVQAGDSLSALAAGLNNPAVTVEALQMENAIANPNAIDVGQVIDVCVGNGLDDRTGQPWAPPPPPPLPPAGASGIIAQQQKLNELLTPFGFPEMSVDGDVGAVTRRGLCAARVALGLSVSRDEMQPGSDEERILMATSSLPVPGDAPGTNRWILIDETCQVLFAGEGGGTVKYVFPTSTGQDEFPTRNGRGWRVFRYDPAVANGGWHDSTDYPASGDNPLNGNMYKPLYFDGGQAIHGANNVPTSPQSHGCARVRPGHQDLIVNWIGLSDVTRELWDPGDIGLSVTVQGQY